MMMRYERKYRIEHHSLGQVESYLQSHPLGFSVLFPDRYVNNIYLDTPDLQFFHENLSGIGERQKYRIRWYGEDLQVIREAVNEIKIKVNDLGTKVQEKVEEELPLGELAPIRDWIRRHVKSTAALEPILLNSYLRSYYQSADGRFRATIDRQLRFHSMEFSASVPEFFAEDPALILEVKYDAPDDLFWESVAENLPFRVGKNSKYVNGVLLTVPA